MTACSLRDEREPVVLRRAGSPPGDDDGRDARSRDLAHLRGDNARVRRGVEAPTGEVRRREHGRAISLHVPVRPAPVPRRGRVPRVVEDRGLARACRSLRTGAAGDRQTRGQRRRARRRRRGTLALRSRMRTLIRASDCRGSCDLGSRAVAEYRYVIVGGGMTGDAACKGIREHDKDGSIGLFAEEAHDPYARPPLTKGLWKGKEESSIWRGTPDLDVDIHTGRTVVSLDLGARTVTDDAGETHSYERLLLATGGKPRRFPSAPDEVIYYRTLDTYHRLRALAGRGSAGDRDRRRIHRLRDRSRARDERVRGHDRLPGRWDRREGVPARALAVRQRLLPVEGRRGPPGREGRRDRPRGRCGFSRRDR